MVCLKNSNLKFNLKALRDAFDNIYDARIPFVWRRGSWASSTLGFWYTELLERNTQFRTWCFQGRPPSFWMTGFFNPQGFLTAMRQEVARSHKGWALDSVNLHNIVTKNTREEIKVAPPVLKKKTKSFVFTNIFMYFILLIYRKVC